MYAIRSYYARGDLQRFIDAGCPRVLLSQPGQSAEAVITSYSIHYTKLYESRKGVPAAGAIAHRHEIVITMLLRSNCSFDCRTPRTINRSRRQPCVYISIIRNNFV